VNKIIELHKVLKLYKRGKETVNAVENINLSVEGGEFLSIVGPSGSGKSTLLNLIGCVDKTTSGSIKIDGMETSNLNDKELTKIRAKKIGFVFQQFFLLPTLTALENVMLPLIFSKKNNQNHNEEKFLAQVNLENRHDHLPTELSGGEMQRVAIARALINDPKILLADEPTGNLDSHNAEIIIDIFKKLNKKGLTIIMVTHNMELAQQTSRIIHIKDGRIL
jgi:putative ABC transport system ATP-binding protein